MTREDLKRHFELLEKFCKDKQIFDKPEHIFNTATLATMDRKVSMY
jgi:hypothetical protein